MHQNVEYLTVGGRASNILPCKSATVLLTSERPNERCTESQYSSLAGSRRPQRHYYNSWTGLPVALSQNATSFLVSFS